MRKILFIAVLSVIGTLFAIAAEQPLRKAPEIAYTVPGHGRQLLSQYHGKVIALEFILTTCPHCQAASRVMTNLQREYGPRGFEALDLAINALEQNRTPEEASAMVAAFTANFQIGFPVGFVPRDSFLAFTGYSIAEYTVVPQLILIDRQGYVRYQTPPRGDETSLKETTIRQRIEELLALPDNEPLHAHARATR